MLFIQELRKFSAIYPLILNLGKLSPYSSRRMVPTLELILQSNLYAATRE